MTEDLVGEDLERHKEFLKAKEDHDCIIVRMLLAYGRNTVSGDV